MLSIFREQPDSVSQATGLAAARNILVSSLNKGLIPSWDHLFHDLPILEKSEDLEVIKNNFLQLTQWDFLAEILGHPGTEYYFHGPECSQRLTLSGEKVSFEIPLRQEDWQLWLEIISIKFKQNWNVQNPFCSFYGKIFEKTFRFSMIHGSTSPCGTSKLILRHLAEITHPMTSFGDTSYLVEAITNKHNTLIAGSTGSGKTSLLSGLLSFVDQNDHLVILEDTYEILINHPHQTRFLSSDSPQTSLKAYLSYSLRLSPDRIILGEMRSHEVVPFLMAMNTGHKGLMGTIHASSAIDALHRMALLFSLYGGEAHIEFDKIMELICRNLEYVVFMENKKVKEVIKILGSEKGVAFFETLIGPKESSPKINLF